MPAWQTQLKNAYCNMENKRLRLKMFLNSSRQNCSCSVNLVYYVVAESRKPSGCCMNFCVTAFIWVYTYQQKNPGPLRQSCCGPGSSRKSFLQTQVHIWKETLIFFICLRVIAKACICFLIFVSLFFSCCRCC